MTGKSFFVTIAAVLLVFLAPGLLTAQTYEPAPETEELQTEELQQEDVQPEAKPRAGNHFWIAGFGNEFILNTQNESAPSPIRLFLTSGLNVRIARSLFYFSPQINASAGYFLLNDGIPAPAEIENRTALVFELMTDVMFTCLLPTDKVLINFGIGASVPARYGFLASGVPEDEAGDVNEINAFFWKDLNWLYPSLSFAMDFPVTKDFNAGFCLKGYIPLGAAVAGRGLDTGRISLSGRITFL